jgi:DNA repair exonuclease SbcCD ATPase subunit
MITFEKCRWKNILSTGNSFTEIDFTRSTNTLIIGSNGAGKSTILDALTFGLFGKPFRKINKPQLVNTINGADAVVEIEFKIGRKQYKIIRGIKPNIFEIYCDNLLVNQDAKAKDYQEHLEKFILKLNYKSFTQVVVLGSAAFIPFMQLTPADRRAIIEDLLDIQIFSSMNSLVKDALSTIKDNTTKYRYDITLTEEKIGYQKQNIEDHKKHNDGEIKKKQEELEANNTQVKTLQKDVELIQKHIDVLQTKITDKLTVEGKNKKFFQLEAKVEANIKKNRKDMEFYEQNDNCPTCQQHIEETFRQTQVNERKTKVETQQKGLKEIESEIFKLNERLVQIEKISKHITAHNNEIVKHNSTISAVNKYITKLNKEITELSTRKDTLMEENDKLKTLNVELEALQKAQEELTIEKQYYDFAATLLKDSGIKTKIIKQYLPVMNKLINKYLTAMDFFVNFNLNESFEGEKQKIDMSLLLTWRQIAKIKNSTNTNLLILDEIFDSSLDANSVEMLMSLLKELHSDTNVFVISHKGDQLFDRFHSIIKFVKKNNFSVIDR